MAYTWGAPAPEPRPVPPDLHGCPVPIVDLLAAIHDPPTHNPPAEQSAAPDPKRVAAA